MKPPTLVPGDEEPERTTAGSGTSRAAAPSRTTEIMTGENEDAEALVALGVPANAFAPGHWIIAQAIAWVIYGDPERPLPMFGSDEEHLFARAERILTEDFQTGQVTLSGRRQSTFDDERPELTPRSEISKIELLGQVILNRETPQSQSWLFVHDEKTHSRNFWIDVLIPAARLRELHPKPLATGDETMQAIGADSEPAQPPPKSGIKRHRGARPKYDWEAVIARLRAKLKEDGCPAPGDGGQAHLERWVCDQFHPDFCPGETMIRVRVSQEIKTFRESLGIKADK